MYDAQVGLQDSVSVLKGIGPKSVRLLAKLDIHTIEDLLYTFPRRFEDRTQTTLLDACTDGEAAYVAGVADSGGGTISSGNSISSIMLLFGLDGSYPPIPYTIERMIVSFTMFSRKLCCCSNRWVLLVDCRQM
jgi:hypothetical protein